MWLCNGNHFQLKPKNNKFVSLYKDSARARFPKEYYDTIWIEQFAPIGKKYATILWCINNFPHYTNAAFKLKALAPVLHVCFYIQYPRLALKVSWQFSTSCITSIGRFYVKTRSAREQVEQGTDREGGTAGDFTWETEWQAGEEEVKVTWGREWENGRRGKSKAWNIPTETRHSGVELFKNR